MFFRKIIFFYCIICLIISGCSSLNNRENTVQNQVSNNTQITSAAKKFKILHIMSYHSPWEWTDTQFTGFQEALGSLEIEYKVFQMDAKNRSSEEWKEKAGKEARDLIDSWKPDLVYTSDDEAQEYVTKYYLNSDLSFVFSSVNKDPAEYGITNSKNVAGVLEREHFVGSVELLRKIVPNAKKIAVIFDDSPIWETVRSRMESQIKGFTDMEFIFLDTIYTYSQYQSIIKEYQSKVDGLCLVGIFNFKDENGNNVPYNDVLKWTEENSKIPDFSFWIDRIYHGTLCSVSVSGYEQGLAAGKIAREILVEGKAPSSFPMKPTIKGEPAINLKRAKSLGITIDSKTLLSSKVVTTYPWED